MRLIKSQTLMSDTLLGARYGSIEPISGISYSELEFEYARQLGMPFFSVILSDVGRAAKVSAHGEKVLERNNIPKFDLFRQNVCSQLCAFFDTPKDIKLAVFETLPSLTSSAGLIGWVPATDESSPKSSVDCLSLG
jgi:hypothetical protein